MDPRLLKPQAQDFMGPPEPMDLEPIAPQAVQPVAPPAQPKAPDFDFSKLMVTPEEIQQRADTKRQNAMLGGIGQALSNQSSFGHAFLGRQPVKHDFSGTVKALDEAADAPIEAKQTLLKQEIQKPELEYMKSKLSMDSDQTKLAQAGAVARLQAYKSFARPELAGVIDEMAKKIPSMNAYDLEKSMSGFDKAFQPIMEAQSKRDIFHQQVTQRQDMQANMIHQRIVNRVIQNKPALQRLSQLQNLENGMAVFLSAEHPSPEQFQELQQTIRSNLGIKGTSGVSERGETYLKSLGNDGRRIMQYFKGEIQDVPTDSAFVQHVKNLAQIEMKNASEQYEKALGAAAQGYGSMYARRPDLKADLATTVQSMRDQAEPTSTQKSVAGGGPKAVPAGGADANAGNAQSARPPIGFVHKGHKYIGGDPSKAESWEALK